MGFNSLANAIRLFFLLITLCGLAFGYYMTKRVMGGIQGTVSLEETDPILWVGDRIAAMIFDPSRRRADQVDATSITDKRVVRIERTVALADLLRPGEADPGADLAELYAEARATDFFRPDCRVLLATIASRCAVIGSEARLLSDGRIEISGIVGFAPVATAGGKDVEAMQESGKVHFRDEWQGFDDSLSVPVPRSAYQEQLAAYMNAADRSCAEFGKEAAACVITQVTLTEEPAAEGQIVLTGAAQYAVAENPAP